MSEIKGVDVSEIYTKYSRCLTGCLVALASVAMVPGDAWAQSDEPEYPEERPSPLDSSRSVVRRKLLFRSTRFEVAPLVGFTLADPFNRNVIAGANLSFHLTNEFGIGATVGASVLKPKTGLRENIESTLGDVGQTDRLGSLAFTQTSFLASIEGSYVPLFGKMSVMNSAIVNYDLHLLFGVGLIGQGASTAVEGLQNPASNAIGGAAVAPMLGFGMRYYVNDFVSINAELRDYVYGSELVSSGQADSELQNNMMLSIGASFFLPSEVKVSR